MLSPIAARVRAAWQQPVRAIHPSNLRLRLGRTTPMLSGAYALIMSSGITSGLGILYWMLAARLYPTSEVGIASAMISTMVFASGVAQLGLYGGLGRFVPKAGVALGRLVGLAYLATAIMAVLVCAAVWLSGMRWGQLDLLADPASGVWLVVATVFWTIFVLQDAILAALRRVVWIPIENGAFGIGKLILLILLAGLATRWGIVVSWTVAAVVVIVPMNLLIFRRWIPWQAARSGPGEPLRLRTVAAFVAGDYVGFLLLQSIIALLPLLVLATLGAEANAYFYLAWLMSYSLTLVAAGLATSLLVEGSREPDRLARSTMVVLRHMAMILIPGIVLMWVLGPMVLEAISPQYSAGSTTLLRILSIAAIPAGISAVWLAIARVRQQTGWVALAQFVNAVIVAALALVLVPEVGVNGAGIAWLVGQTITAVLLTGALVLWIGRFRPRGITVALLGPDGAGKSTLAAAISRETGHPAKQLYLGLWADSYLARFRFAPWLGIVLRPLFAWRAFLLGQIHRAFGHTVIFDRYTYDAFVALEPGGFSLRRAYFWLIAHSCPGPDLVLVLDSPSDVMFGRKGESTLPRLEEERTRYRALVDRLPNARLVDSSREPGIVVHDALGHIQEALATSQSTTGESSPPIAGVLMRLIPSRLVPEYLDAPGRARTGNSAPPSRAGGSGPGFGSAATGPRPAWTSPAWRRIRHTSRNLRHAQDVGRARQIAESLLRDRSVSELLGIRHGVVQAASMTESRVVHVYVGDAGMPPATILKIVGKAEHTTSLERHVVNLRALQSVSGLGDWRRLLPNVAWHGEVSGQLVVAEQFMQGTVASDAMRSGPDTREILSGAITAISALHQSTGSERVVTPQLFQRWVRDPADRIHQTGILADDSRAALDRLVRYLEDWLAGRSVGIGWIHGDYWPGNLLITPHATVAGILDWDQAAPDEYFGHDLLHLLLYSRRIRTGTDIGIMVARMLNDPAWAPIDQELLSGAPLSLPEDAAGIRAVLMLYWVRYVTRLLQQRHHAGSRTWVDRNISSVLRSPSLTRLN